MLVAIEEDYELFARLVGGEVRHVSTLEMRRGRSISFTINRPC